MCLSFFKIIFINLKLMFAGAGFSALFHAGFFICAFFFARCNTSAYEFTLLVIHAHALSFFFG